MMDILGLHAFWICFHGTEKGKLSKWRIWHYSALTLSCNIYTSKTPVSGHFKLKTAPPAKALFLFENNVGAATVQKNVPHPVKQNELGYILKTCHGFPTEPASFIFQHKFVLIKFCLNCTLCFLWFAVSRLFSTDLFEKEMRCRIFFFGLIFEHSSMRCRNQNESGLWLFVACCGSLWVFQELPNKCDYQNPNGMGSL